TIAPTRTIPWIAFVPDMSGVCRSVGTFEITSKPRKIARISTVSSIRKLVVNARPAGERSSPHRLGPGDAGPGGDLVVEVELQLASGRQMGQQGEDVPRVELARVERHRAGQ